MLHPDQMFVRLPVNTKGRDFFCGDLHGCVPLLEKLMWSVRFDPDKDRLLSCGDVVDHGVDSLGALKRLQSWPFFHAVLGNHEALALGAMEQLTVLTNAAEISLSNGGRWQLALTAEERLELQQIFVGMPLAIEVPLRDGRKVGLIHAEIRNPAGWAIVKRLDLARLVADDSYGLTDESAMIWGRVRMRALKSFADREYPTPQKIIDYYRRILCRVRGIDLLISGHTITSDRQPVAVANMLFIDTGAYLPDGALSLVDPLQGAYWQARWDESGSKPSARVVRRLLPGAIALGKSRRRKSSTGRAK